MKPTKPNKLQMLKPQVRMAGTPKVNVIGVGARTRGEGANARLVWDALGGLFKANGLRRPEGVPEELPVGRPVLSLEEAIEGTKNRLPCDADQRGYRARLAITSLVTSDLLTFREGWLWVS